MRAVNKTVRFPQEIIDLVDEERAALQAELQGVEVSWAQALISLVQRGSKRPLAAPLDAPWRSKLGRPPGG
jgi:hypothetical protein